MDERFLKDEGIELFTGNELILKGALEAEVGLITGYPGSPVSDIFDTAYANRELLKKHGILAEMANNEALSVARLNGSRMAGIRAMAVMKSVGLHVAADGLALGNLSEPHNAGGSLVVVGDDPWIDSTQVNNDSRFLSQHLFMPVLEPSTFQELKDWVRVAFELSSASNLYITYLVTTNQADGGGTVWVHPNQFASVNTLHPVTLNTQDIVLDRQVLLPPRTYEREATLAPRFATLLNDVRQRKLNRRLDVTPEKPLASGMRHPVGLVTSGLSYCYLEHALSELGLTGRFPILKFGVTYPLDPEAVLDFSAHVDQMVIVEEKRGFIESQVVTTLHHARQAGTLTHDVRVWGKRFPNDAPGFPETRGLNASVVTQTLIPFLLEFAELSDDERARLRREQALLEATSLVPKALPARTPTFCPGCPHRDSSSVFLQIKKDFMDPSYMKRTHQQSPVDLVFHGETGCFTMLMFEPNKPLMHNYSGMGLGGGTGAGLDPFVTNKQIVFLGDSTFFHSGMVAISDSIKSGQDITYIILDNKTTAMTGHQPTAGTDLNLMGERTFAQNIETIVQGMAAGGSIPVTRVNPEAREPYRALLEDTVLQSGVKVIIADKECGLTFHRQKNRERQAVKRRQGFVAEDTFINVTPEVCEFCLECTKTTGCPGLTIEDTSYGPKIVTDLSSCVSDGACAKVKVCPSFEEVTVLRRAPARTTPVLPSVASLPPPVTKSVTTAWYACTAGIGGMGAGLVSSVMVRAAQREGFRVLFSDKKGLAVRNGSVFGHLVISRLGGALAPLVPYGKADLILGIDLLETARTMQGDQNLRVAGIERTAVVVNTARHPTVRMLMGEDVSADDQAIERIRQGIRPGGYWGADVSAISQFYFGNTLYANMLLLGVASQRGELPVSAESLEWAIDQAVPPNARADNRNAFQAGRLLAVEPERFQLPQKVYTFASLLDEKVQLLTQTENAAAAREYRWRVNEAVMKLHLPEADQQALAIRVYDLIRYDRLAYAQRYLELVLRTAEKDRSEWRYEATRAVIWNAFKLMAIKDEVYVAQLLTRPEKRARDAARYHIDEKNGDRIQYKHLTRPEFTIFGRAYRWDMTTRDWQLKIMAQMKFLRTLLPGWHKEEREFRDWYLDLVDRFDADHEGSYRLWLQILQSPADVTGYREVRKPKMDQAKQNVERWWKELHDNSQPPTVFRPIRSSAPQSS